MCTIPFLRISASLMIYLLLGSPHVTHGNCPSDVCVCIEARSIICSKRNLDILPDFEDFDDESTVVTYDMLDLSRNDIYSIPPAAFENIRVKHIDLSRNAIAGISPRGFKGVGKTLQSLNFYNAGIKVC